MRGKWPVGAVTCQELTELVTDFLEGALSPARLQAVTEHLKICKACSEYVAQVRRTVALLRNRVQESAPAETKALLLRTFRALRRQ